MSKKVWIPLAVVAVLIVAGLITWIAWPNAEDPTLDLDSAMTEAVNVAPGEGVSADAPTAELDADNTDLQFAVAKDVAGKTSIVQGGWDGDLGSTLSGKAAFDPQTGRPIGFEAVIDVGSLWSEHAQLTESLKTQGFFKVDEHPTATFTSTSVTAGKPESARMPDANYTVAGNLTINGVTKGITFPAKIETTEGNFTLNSTFGIDRRAFDIIMTGGWGLLGDEDIADQAAMTLRIDVPLPEGISEGAVADAEGQEDEDDGSASDATDKSATVDVDELPSNFVETIPETQVSFAMNLVPGDPEQGIEPFYMGQHEVTWDEFMPWAQIIDFPTAEHGKLRAMNLRPSPPYGSVDRNFGMQDRPALSMSKLSAELYCEWLSEQTGKNYRLPTEEEWKLAYLQGGGDPETAITPEAADEVGVYIDNAWDDAIGDWATKPVGSTKPNALGIYDMAGNVAEWVTETGEENVALGGHFDAPLVELGIGRYVEDQTEWNRDYPNEPKSIWWYVNARWVGFRVVCDADKAVLEEASASPEEKTALPDAEPR